MKDRIEIDGVVYVREGKRPIEDGLWVDPVVWGVLPGAKYIVRQPTGEAWAFGTMPLAGDGGWSRRLGLCVLDPIVIAPSLVQPIGDDWTLWAAKRPEVSDE